MGWLGSVDREGVGGLLRAHTRSWRSAAPPAPILSGRGVAKRPGRTRDWPQRPGQACARRRSLPARLAGQCDPAAPHACGRLSRRLCGRRSGFARLVGWAGGTCCRAWAERVSWRGGFKRIGGVSCRFRWRCLSLRRALGRKGEVPCPFRWHGPREGAGGPSAPEGGEGTPAQKSFGPSGPKACPWRNARQG